MLKFLSPVFFGLLLIGAAGIAPAQSGTATFYVTSNAPYNVMIKFFSENGNWVWPGPNNHYNLDDDAKHQFRLSCANGEKICYGAAYRFNGGHYWGFGIRGDKGCKSCCLTCGNNVWYSWTLYQP